MSEQKLRLKKILSEKSFSFMNNLERSKRKKKSSRNSLPEKLFPRKTPKIFVYDKQVFTLCIYMISKQRQQIN